MSDTPPSFDDLLRTAHRRGKLLPLMMEAMPLSDKAKLGLRTLGRSIAQSLLHDNPSRGALEGRVYGLLVSSAASSHGFGLLLEAVHNAVEDAKAGGSVTAPTVAFGLGLTVIEAAAVAAWEGEDLYGSGAFDENARSKYDAALRHDEHDEHDKPEESGGDTPPDFASFWKP